MKTSRLRFVETDSQTEKESVAEEKKRLRGYMRARRGENENRDVKERLLTENVFQLLDERFKEEEKKTAFVYLSYSSEAPTDGLIEEFLNRGWKVYCPQVKGKEMKAVAYGEDFELSSLGIREPIGEAYDGMIAVAIVPMLAVDKQGRRLGYGGGFYDRYFEKHPDVLRIAYGFDFQIVKKVPSEDFDATMDAIVTDKQIVWIRD
ncbi:MAG: 5-formyltetrahydrofolate cyclo-ligase [Clostridia bacterium]|nr:5-formyltetrahydrofolate cyclo-ligase [Clostridia bacterium]